MLMLRFYSRLLLLTLLAFTLLILLIRSQPYDDPDLRALLMLSDCGSPCFMGITPGVTTFSQSYNLLQHVHSIQLQPLTFFGNETVFQWTGQFAPFDEADTGAITAENQVIRSIALPTTISLGRIWALYGQPDWSNGSDNYDMSSPDPVFDYVIGYADKPFIIGFQVKVEHGGLRNIPALLATKITCYFMDSIPSPRRPHPTLTELLSGAARTSAG